MQVILDQEQYEALIFFARRGAGSDATTLTRLEQFLRAIEKQNDIARSFLWVQWQELSAPLPPGTSFPTKWPPELRKAIELIGRPIARADVDAVIAQYASEPTSVLVTKDPAALVGWTKLEDYFRT